MVGRVSLGLAGLDKGLTGCILRAGIGCAMKPVAVATIVCLSPNLESCAEAAVALLASCGQELGFRFVFGGVSEALSNSDSRAPHSWSVLEQVLAAERGRRRCEHLIGVLDEPIENNYFSRTACGKNIAWITTNDWQFYSDIPASAFVAYEILSNLVLMLIAKRPEDEEWLVRDVIHTRETRECISDLCAYKPDIGRKIRSGGVCEDCRRVLRDRLGEAPLEELLGLLGVVARAATAKVPGGPNASWQWQLPGVLKMTGMQFHQRRSDASGRLEATQRALEATHANLARAHEVAATLRGKWKELRNVEEPGWDIEVVGEGASGPAKERAEVERKLRSVEAEIDRLNQYEEACRLEERKGRQEEVERERLGYLLSEQRSTCYDEQSAWKQLLDATGAMEQVEDPNQNIERDFPFPIAYCFRAMRAELSPTDRWLYLYDLYKLMIRYITFVLLADRADRRIDWRAEVAAMAQELKDCSDGKWGKACFGLIRQCREYTKKESVVGLFLDRLDEPRTRDLEAISRAFVEARNSRQGHGHPGQRTEYERLFENHMGGIKRLLNSFWPLSRNLLIRPLQVVHHYQGECVFVSKVLMGSNPLFVSCKLYGNRLPETVCQLLSPKGDRQLSLDPWLHLDRCETCQREMVFLYDAVTGFGDKAVAKLREYPSNHEKERPDLTGKVLSCLRGG